GGMVNPGNQEAHHRSQFTWVVLFVAGALECPRHLLRRAIQSVVEAREPRAVGSRPPRNISERGQVNAVEPSKAVLLGKLTRDSAQGISGVQRQIRRPLLLEVTLR